MDMDDQDDAYSGIEETLSLDRFGTYLGWAAGDRNAAISAPRRRRALLVRVRRRAAAGRDCWPYRGLRVRPRGRRSTSRAAFDDVMRRLALSTLSGEDREKVLGIIAASCTGQPASTSFTVPAGAIGGIVKSTAFKLRCSVEAYGFKPASMPEKANGVDCARRSATGATWWTCPTKAGYGRSAPRPASMRCSRAHERGSRARAHRYQRAAP